jgi:hypothetical protein
MTILPDQLVKAIHFQAETFLTERQHFRVWVATPAHLLLEVVSVDRHALLPLVLANPEQNVSNLGNASLRQQDNEIYSKSSGYLI